MPSVVTNGEYMIYWIGLGAAAIFAVVATIISRMK